MKNKHLPIKDLEKLTLFHTNIEKNIRTQLNRILLTEKEERICVLATD